MSTPLPDPAQTSGTTSYGLNIIEIAEEAYERAGAEMRSGYDFRTARRSLNLLTIEWASRGLNLWTLDSGSIPLLQGVATYSLPGDTVDLIEHAVSTVAATAYETPLQRISVSTYMAISNKTLAGTPSQVFIHRRTGANDGLAGAVLNPTVTTWPVADRSGMYTLTYWRLRRIQDTGDGVTVPDIPFRLLPALVAGLAYYIAMKLPLATDRLPMLKAEYDRQWDLAAGEDRERASLRIVPRVSR